MINKKILFALPVIIAFSGNAFAINTNNNSALEILNRFTLDDINQIYQSCGSANSLATTCAVSFNKVVQAHFKDFKPITASDVNKFWEQCYDVGNNKLCAQNLNAILKTHMSAKSHYTVSEDDVNQVKNSNFLGSNADYSLLMKQARDLFSSE